MPQLKYLLNPYWYLPPFPHLLSNIPTRNPNPAKTVKQHIHLLHAYNDIRDVGMGLLGIVAENRGVRIRDVYEDFGVSGDD